MTRRLLQYGALGGGLLVALVVAVLAFNSMHVPFQGPTPSSPAPARNCSPSPCANLQGYTVWISNVAVTGDVVRMQIVFKNSSDSTHASPQDLQLIDSKHNGSRLITDSPGCKTWDRHVFNNGAQFGPLTICFRPSSTTPPLVLRWSPDFGFLCCEADIKLD